MCLPSILWTFILFYVPLFRSMGRCSILCAVVPIYGPSSTFYGPFSFFYITLISFPTYVPSFDSMDLYSVLWAIISLYGPLFHSMCRRPGLCAVVPIYGPSSTFYGPFSFFYITSISFPTYVPSFDSMDL